MYDYEDYFYEPSENDIVMQEVGDIIKKMVRKDLTDELERLRKENAELRQYRDEHNSYERKVRDLEYKCALAIENAQKEAKRARLHELLGDNLAVGYMIASNNKRKPKCDKCDEYRRIHYKTPMGRDAIESCECDDYERFYEVKETELIQIHIRKTNGWNTQENIYKYYRHVRNTYDDKADENDYDYVTIVYNGQSFENIKNSYYGTVFLNKDECQEFCDWMNKQLHKEKNQ